MSQITWGSAHVDDTHALSRGLTDNIEPKAFQLLIQFQEVGSTMKRKGDGQVRFIQKNQLAASPGGTMFHYSVIHVTAKHNLRCHVKNNKTFHA
jgi:hypothetical protein